MNTRMNIVIIYGTIISKIEIKFIYDRFKTGKMNTGKYQHTSISSYKIKLTNKSIIEIYGYDKVADYMYRNLKENDNILLIGRLDSEGKIETHELFLIQK